MPSKFDRVNNREADLEYKFRISKTLSKLISKLDEAKEVIRTTGSRTDITITRKDAIVARAKLVIELSEIKIRSVKARITEHYDNPTHDSPETKAKRSQSIKSKWSTDWSNRRVT